MNNQNVSFQLAQVQNMVRSQQHQHHSTPIPNHHPNFADKLVEDSLFQSPSSPPHGATVNQLLRRATMPYRHRERRISTDPENEHKRARAAEHLLGNNNNNNNELNLSHTHPPQTQPADFSPSGMKNNNNALNLNVNASIKSEIEGKHFSVICLSKFAMEKNKVDSEISYLVIWKNTSNTTW